MKKSYVITFLLLLLAYAGCDSDSEVSPTVPPVEEPSLESLVIANCKAVQAAAEAWGAEYPESVTEADSRTHLTMIDLLPEGVKLVNPYTGLRTAPRDGFAVYPGETCYQPYYGAYTEWAIGYRITGYGLDGPVVSLSNYPDDVFYFEDIVIENCFAVRDAAEAFAAENNGVYPANLADNSAAGQTVIDLLPGGNFLQNPFTRCETEPVDGGAANCGETGYVAVDPNGDGIWDGYLIDGVGAHAGIVIITLYPWSPEDETVVLNCVRLEDAVERFAGENSGFFPGDVDVDTTLAGHTVMDLLPRPLVNNPYTGQPTVPQNELASSRGDIGYEPVYLGPDVVGYVINGWGAREECKRLQRNP